MPIVKKSHCKRAIIDIARFGDNDVLPFDVDNRFFREESAALLDLVFAFARSMEKQTADDVIGIFKELRLFSERLLAPAGYSGFRITTKIHPFWNAYFNSLAIALAERNETERDDCAHSYRYLRKGEALFD